jgi:hypothetical protein
VLHVPDAVVKEVVAGPRRARDKFDHCGRRRRPD